MLSSAITRLAWESIPLLHSPNSSGSPAFQHAGGHDMKWQDLPASICSVGAQGHVLIVPGAPAGAGCMFHFAQVGFGHSTAKGCLGSFGRALPSLSLCLSPLILQAPQVWGSFPVQGTELHQITNKQSVQSISLCSSPGRIRSSSTT